MSTSVLFDAPGPRARARHRLLTLLGLLLAAGTLALVLWKFAQQGQLEASMWRSLLLPEVWTEYVLPGIRQTLAAAGASIVAALVFGLVFGMGRLSTIRPVRWVAGTIVEFFRAVPVLLMMYFTFTLYARNNVFGVDFNSFYAVVTGLTLYNGSVIAELVRSGVHQLPKGQSEAGLSIGLSPGQTLRSIELPQALTAMLPALVGQLVVILKDSALGTAITYPELLAQAKNVGTAYGNVIPAYVLAAALFILLNYGLTVVAGRVERRINRRGRAAGGTTTNAMPGAPGGTGAMPSTGLGGDNVQNLDPTSTGR
ncbi:amino acid ABC transporter permease [Phycicoccus sonneratiae]|uniref:Amino acid ABC transporter permease n=1 Tax=Phycicoccus sonneratiae TaxID=2807628 RepID=A0ABS2CGF4_9MICO|nr:amino acid ABC transporter permease [Phycicoccus sonneraticus]MBM6398860.1 amino acid ABC transporter permease [Phycicoccus sonneraticus]